MNHGGAPVTVPACRSSRSGISELVKYAMLPRTSTYTEFCVPLSKYCSPFRKSSRLRAVSQMRKVSSSRVPLKPVY